MNEWINVEDKLPDKEERVLAYNGKIFVSDYRGIDKYERHLWETDLMGIDPIFVFDVSHWMPLPEPPK